MFKRAHNRATPRTIKLSLSVSNQENTMLKTLAQQLQISQTELLMRALSQYQMK